MHASLSHFDLTKPFNFLLLLCTINTFTSETRKSWILFNKSNKHPSTWLKKQSGLEESGTFQGFQNSSKYTKGFSLHKEIVSTKEACFGLLLISMCWFIIDIHGVCWKIILTWNFFFSLLYNKHKIAKQKTNTKNAATKEVKWKYVHNSAFKLLCRQVNF